MEIIIAKTAGFCFGVDKAIQKVNEAIGNEDYLYTYGPIIHNQQVVNELQEKGVIVIDNLSQLDKIKVGTIIIRSHGVGKHEINTMLSKGFKIIDATCPYVKRIHKIVEDASQDGNKVIIIGNAEHPEVIGIKGWSSKEVNIIEKTEDIDGIGFEEESKYCLVAQTTFNFLKYKEIVNKLQKNEIHVMIYETICSATEERQMEAIELSKKATKMIVIGGKHSSNTQKLYHICKSQCDDTYHIETAEDLVLNVFDDNDIIGITAGASTPKNIIEEVILKMSEEQSFEQMLEESFVAIRRGEVIEGTVIGVNEDEIYVNIGYKSDGIIPKSEFSNFPSISLKDSVKEGDKIRAKVLKVNDGEGQVLLTYKRLQTEEGMKKVEKLCKSREEVTGKVSLVLEGGLIVIIDEVRVFIPASLVSDSYVTDLQAYKNQEITFIITEVNQKKNRIIGNRRILLEHEKNIQQEETFKTLAEGAVLTGEVKNITDYGVFVNLNGVDGLVHISELSWGRVKSPKDIVKVGDVVKVKVISINQDKKKVSLTMKFPEDNPWNNAEQKYAVGNVVEGRVARMTEFGAFIELEVGIDALLHVSQISVKHIDKPKDILKIGQRIQAKVTELDLEGKKISLSIKVLEAEKEDQTATDKVEDVKVEEKATEVVTEAVQADTNEEENA